MAVAGEHTFARICFGNSDLLLRCIGKMTKATPSRLSSGLQPSTGLALEACVGSHQRLQLPEVVLVAERQQQIRLVQDQRPEALQRPRLQAAVLQRLCSTHPQ